MTVNVFESTRQFDASPWDATRIDWRAFLKRPIYALSGSTVAARNRTILITGAGGSIGAALARRLMEEPDCRLLLLDNSRERLETLVRGYKERNGGARNVEFLQCDIRDAARVGQMFSTFRPDCVFHAAALKHLVPLESDPFAALETNFSGTTLLLDQAMLSRVRLFVNVSTDKAVQPTSVLGVSKRISERLLLAMESREGCWITVRFGNVLGSSGSVAPLLLNAIRHQQPVLMTHPDASRYFMMLDEVVAVLLNCLHLPESSLLLPDMGSERKVVDLARFLMALSSSESGIRYVGLRDGEKCSEALTYPYEYTVDTNVPGLSRVLGNPVDPDLPAKLARLRDLIYNRRTARLVEALTAIEPEFTPSPTFSDFLSRAGI